MMQIFGQLSKLRFGQLLFSFFLGFLLFYCIFIQLFFKLLIFFVQCQQLLFSFVKTMNIFSHIKSMKSNILITLQIFFVLWLLGLKNSVSFFCLFSFVCVSEIYCVQKMLQMQFIFLWQLKYGLIFTFFHFQKLFSFDVHFKFRLYFKGCNIVSLPILLCLIGFEIVFLDQILVFILIVLKQLHVIIFNIIKLNIILNFHNMEIQNQIEKQMGNLCPCPKRKQKKPVSYDVHQQTFEIQQNISSPQIQKPHSFQILNQEKKDPSQISKQSSKVEIRIQSKQQQKMQIKVQQKIVEPPKEQPPKKKQYSFQRKQYNPDDYRFINLTDSFRVKNINSIKQQQFNIDNCKNCIFYIFDITANIYIDNSQNCFIFCAPCQSSIFLRDCKNMNIISASKQFRIRDCFNCNFSIYCNSQPVIQSSNNITFSNFYKFSYTQLYDQFKKAKMELWNNHWSQIFDFTKKQGEKHYELVKQLNFQIKFWQKALVEAGLKQSLSMVPTTYGDLDVKAKRQVIVVFNKKGTNNEVELLNHLNGSNIIILRSFKGKLPSEVFRLLQQVFEGSKSSDLYLCIKIGDVQQKNWIQEFERYSRQDEYIVIREEVERLSSMVFISFKDEH